MAARVHARDRSRFTALDYAADSGHMDIVRLLAPIPLPSSDVSITPPVSGIETREKYLSMALMRSAKNGHFEISRYLISEGADVNFLDDRCYLCTPLFDDRGIVPLFRAADCRSVDIAQALLAADAKVDAQDHHSRNVLFEVHNDDIEMLRFLLECGADLNHRDNSGRTPYRAALNRRVRSSDEKRPMKLSPLWTL
ncbi:ankyrin repeat-containing domain protein [Mycena haematopus]|nr:ankyrin repeat-containing domain protein [Mycena haematopus]